MSKFVKLILKILHGNSDKNISFDELCNVLLKLEFDQRVKDGHHIFTKNEIEEIINLQASSEK